MSDADSVCAVCQIISSLKCGRCRAVAYCSREHQKLDWKVHKGVCTAHTTECFEIAEDEKLGRHLVATRPISNGEIIFEEAPLITGPMQETPPVCLGCYTLLNKINSQDCSKCGWPVCSKACENSSFHKPECEITAKYKKEKVSIKTFEINHPSYRCLTVLRCLYLKNHSPGKWERIVNLESHSEKMKTLEKYGNNVVMVAKFIPRFFNCCEFTEEEILKVIGIVEVNAHHVPLKEPGYISIYDKGSMLEHNCRSNCSKSFSNDGKIIIRAGRGINKGEHISISYTEPLWGRELRLEHLLTTKFFSCQCERCVDPTELGTHFNSFKCLDPGCKGYIVPHATEASPKNLRLCTTCEKIYTDEDLKDFFEEIKGGISKLNESDTKSCKEFLSVYGKRLHPNHYFMVKVKLALIKYYEEHKMIEASNEDLKLIIKIIKDLNSLTSHLIPAENRLRGFLYFQLHSALVVQNRREPPNEKMDVSESRQKLLVNRNILQKAYSFLKYEPEALAEGKMAAIALKYIEDINKILGATQLL